MLDYLNNFFNTKVDEQKFNHIHAQLSKRYTHGKDPWGLDLECAKKVLPKLYPFYCNYFKVRIFGKEKVQNRPYMIVANHSGQIPIDAMLISMAFVLDIDPPRILRPMIDRFVTSLPFIGEWFAQTGAVLGDRQNCLKLMKRDESILVFPEGIKGVAKNTSQFYELQKFTRGFYRMALASGFEILPIAVVGCEECFPFVYHLDSLAKKLGVPALPLSANYFPLPSPVDIHIGNPVAINPDLTSDSPDKEIEREVRKIKNKIKTMINRGRKSQRDLYEA
jgi:1-acyl-sn-glycerol-3-phosphate acyltransferase